MIVADDPLARAGLAALLGGETAVSVISQLATGDVLADLEENELERVDAIVWDVGWDAQASVAEWHTFGEPIIALVPEESDPETFWDAGAKALLLRNAGVGQILTAVQAALENLHTFDPALIPDAPSAPIFSTKTTPPELTPREQEVIELLAKGLTNKAIAQKLQISSNTVKFHVTAIMTKLNAQSRTEAVVRATRFGLLSL